MSGNRTSDAILFLEVLHLLAIGSNPESLRKLAPSGRGASGLSLSRFLGSKLTGG